MKIFSVLVFGLFLSFSAFAAPHHWCDSYDGHMVVGLGDINHHPEGLFRQGCESAILNAESCAVTGQFVDGVDCWAAYGGCSNGAWSGAGTSNDIQTYVAALKAQYAATGTCSYSGNVAP